MEISNRNFENRSTSNAIQDFRLTKEHNGAERIPIGSSDKHNRPERSIDSLQNL